MQRWKYRNWVVLLWFLVLGFVVYAPAIKGPFVFDDKFVILNPDVRERRDLWGYVTESVKLSRDGGPLGTRSLVQATFLANWLVGGESTVGYHAVNIFIHVAAAFLVFILVTQLLEFIEGRLKIYDSRLKRRFWLAAFGGGVFLLHPLQTQAVAYISQRFMSMASAFYLLAIVLYLKARQIANSKWQIDRKNVKTISYKLYAMRPLLYVGSWVAAFVAMSSKEIAVTLPVILVGLETLIVSPGVKRSDLSHASRGRTSRIIVLVAFFLLSLKIPVQLVASGDIWQGGVPKISDIANQLSAVEKRDLAMTPMTYLMTQFSVVRTYIRLLIVPVGQSIDHDYPLTRSFSLWPTGVSLGLLVVILGVGIKSLTRSDPVKQDLALKQDQVSWRLLGLGILWFFVALSVSSSVFVIRDVIYEHRVYLAMVGWAIFLVFLFKKLGNKFQIIDAKLPIILLSIYGMLTLSRSFVWASDLSLWRDAWEKAPAKPRTNKNYGLVLVEEKRFAEGIERLEQAVELNPGEQNYRIALGSAYLRVENWERARVEFEKAVEIDPDKSDGWNNLGVAWFHLKDYDASKARFMKAIDLDSNSFMAWSGLGGAEMLLGNVAEGEKAYRRAIELEPEDIGARSNLVSILIVSRRWRDALAAIEELEAVDPNMAGLTGKKQQIENQIENQLNIRSD